MTEDVAAQQKSGEGVSLRLGVRNRPPGNRAAIARVKIYVRERFKLSEDDVVMVSELECALPGCPPLETVIAFWTEDTQRRHYKIFKPVREVVEDDLPPSWMKNALIVLDGMGCDCC
jgi:nitrate reductase delta subunit